MLRVMVKIEGRTRGFCFVRYYSPEAAKNALQIKIPLRHNTKPTLSISWDNKELIISREVMESCAQRIRPLLTSFEIPIIETGVDDCIIKFSSHQKASQTRKNVISKGNILVQWRQKSRCGVNNQYRRVTFNMMRQESHTVNARELNVVPVLRCPYLPDC